MNKLPPKPDDDQVAAYLLGALSPQEERAIEHYAGIDATFAAQLEHLRASMDSNVHLGKAAPPPSAKAKLFEELDRQPESVGVDFPPYIHAGSKIADFQPWMSEAMATLAQSSSDFECLPIGSSADTFTFLAKMCSSIPEEVHTAELERVMVVEGHCDFIVGGQVHHFGPGDQYRIPLYVAHSAQVTGDIPCIFLVQRTVL